MKRLKKGTIVQIFGVLTLVVGQFFTAGTALADTSQTREVSAGNAAIVDDERRMVGGARVGDKKKLFFNVLANGNEKSGTVNFAYNHDFLEIKKKKYHYAAGDAELTVKIDEDESTISWQNVDNRQHIFNVELPVEFKKTIESGNLAIQVDGKNTKLPFIQVVPKAEQAPKGETDGDLANDSSINEMLEKEQAQKNQEKAQEYLKEKQKADAEKAEAKNEEAKQAKPENESAESQAAQKKQSQAAAKERASKTVEQIESEVTTTEEALDEADGEGERPQKRIMAGTAYDNVVNGNRDLSGLIERNFFNKIMMTYEDINNKEKTIKVYDGDKDKYLIEELPEILRVHKNVSLEYFWDLTSIEENNELVGTIQDGDFYEFELKGFKYNYKEEPYKEIPISAMVGGSAVNVGTMTISPGENEGVTDPYGDVHKVRITFNPGQYAGEANIDYNAKIETEINSEAESFEFGEIADTEGQITLPQPKFYLNKSAEFFQNEEGVTDLDKITWKVNYKTDEGFTSKKVILEETFGDGYNFSGIDYDVKVTGLVNGTVQTETFTQDDGFRGKSNTMWTFDTRSGALHKAGFTEIHEIQLDLHTPITKLTQNKFNNAVCVGKDSIINSSDEDEVLDTNSENVRAEITKSDKLTKKSLTQPDGRIKYTVEFELPANKDLTEEQRTIIDELTGSDKFEIKNDNIQLFNANDTNNSDLWDQIESHDNTGKKLKFIVPEKLLSEDGITRFRLVYYVGAKADEYVTPKDYATLTNQITTGNYTRENKFSGNSNLKSAQNINWDKRTVDWQLNINKFGSAIKGGNVKIQEPIKDTGKYQDYSKFIEFIKECGESLESNSELGEKLAEFLEVKKDKTKYNISHVSGTEFKITVDRTEAKMTLGINNNDVPISINFEGLPENIGNFQVTFKNIGIRTDKMVDDVQFKVTNWANIHYNDEDSPVYKEFKMDDFMFHQASKNGVLSENFHLEDERYIDWTTTFNHKGSLGTDEDNILRNGITITDITGPDNINRYKEERLDQNLQEYKNDVLDNLEIRLGRLQPDGKNVTYDSREKLKQDADYVIKNATVKNNMFTFQLFLQGKALERYKAGESIIEMKFRSEVPKLIKDSDKKYDHLKSWRFNNNFEVSYGDNKKQTTSGHVEYTDDGYLLDKTANEKNTTIEVTEDDGTVEQLTAHHWEVVINGDGRNMGRGVVIRDELDGKNHNHLETPDQKYRLGIYKAEKAFINGKVEYGKSENQLLEDKHYKVKYSESLNTMTITFDTELTINEPLILDYYTVVTKLGSATKFSNKVAATTTGGNFDEIETIESNASASGNIKNYGVNFTKVDSKSGEALEGFEFELQKKTTYGWKNALGDKVYRTTDKDGKIRFRGLLEKPKYRIVEVGKNENYDTRYISDEFTIDQAEKEESSSDGDENEGIYSLTAKNDAVDSLRIHKQIKQDEDISSEQLFQFELQVIDDGEIDTSFNNTYEVYVGDEMKVCEFVNGVMELPKITHDQTIHVKGIPTKLKYQVVEDKKDGFSTNNVLSNVNEAGSLPKTDNQTGSFMIKSDEDLESSVTFTNTLETNDLSFTKTIKRTDDGDATKDKQRDFYFELQALKGNGQLDTDFNGIFPGTKGDQDVLIKFEGGLATKYSLKSDEDNQSNKDNWKEISLKHNESFNDIKIPVGTKIKVREKIDSKYSAATIKHGENSTPKDATEDEGYFNSDAVTLDKDRTIDWTNVYKSSSFGFDKTIEGPNVGEDRDKKEFNYTIKLDNNFTGLAEGKFVDAEDNETTVWLVFNDGIATQYSESEDGTSPQDIRLKHKEAYRNIELDGSPTVEVTETVDKKYSRVQYLTSGNTKREEAKVVDGTDQVTTRKLSTDNYKFIQFFNIHDANKLEVVKQVEGEILEGMDPFTFSITAYKYGNESAIHDEVAGRTYKAAIMKANVNEVISEGTVEFDSEGVAEKFEPTGTGTQKIVLKNHERLVIYDLPKEVTFGIDEVFSMDYTPSWLVKGEDDEFNDGGHAVVNMLSEDKTVLFNNKVRSPFLNPNPSTSLLVKS